jgi:hypothetical protein
MSLTLEQSDLFLSHLLHSEEEEREKGEKGEGAVKRRRTVSTSFEQSQGQRVFKEDRRTRSFGQDVAKLSEGMPRRVATFTSIPEEEEEDEEEGGGGRTGFWSRLEAMPGIGIVLVLLTVIIYQVSFNSLLSI